MTNKIAKEDVLMEMKVALADEFVATVEEKEGGLSLRFANGQTFQISVKEL